MTCLVLSVYKLIPDSLFESFGEQVNAVLPDHIHVILLPVNSQRNVVINTGESFFIEEFAGIKTERRAAHFQASYRRSSLELLDRSDGEALLLIALNN
ncbi:MAG: hypothetical protein ACJ74W_24130 [Pyrinomonadaceae bacterium]